MKLIRFLYKNKIFSGTLKGDEVILDNGEKTNLLDVKLLAPCVPSKIVCIGLNYRDHAAELGMDVPEEPIIFIKPSTAVVGPEEDIIYPASSSQLDFEAELAVIIKSETKNIKKEKADEYILGYTCFNDVTARDLQRKDIQWTRAKSFDTFAPIGPWIETEVDTKNLRISSYLNNEVKQDSSTSEFIFSIPELIEFTSSVMTLFPGDVIATGTPPGIGSMNPGDEIVVSIEGVGKLKNTVKKIKP